MDPLNAVSALPIGELFETLLPDFVLAFAFFTASVSAGTTFNASPTIP